MVEHSPKNLRKRGKSHHYHHVWCARTYAHTRARTHTHTHAHTQILHYLVSTDHRHIAEQLNAHYDHFICNIKVHVR